MTDRVSTHRVVLLALVCGALLLAACGGSVVRSDPPPDTSTGPSDTPTPPRSEPPETGPVDPTVLVAITPFLSSAIDDQEFAPEAYGPLRTIEAIDTEDVRSQLVALAGGPAARLDDIDLDRQFIVSTSAGGCRGPGPAPVLEITDDSAVFVTDEQVSDDEEPLECYRLIEAVHFYAVDREFRDRFSGAIDDLDGVVWPDLVLTATSVTPALLDSIAAPTFVDGPADVAALAAEVTDDDVRSGVIRAADQTVVLVPVTSCDPQRTTVRIRLSAEARIDVIDPPARECDVGDKFVAVFRLNDTERDVLRATAPASWNRGLEDGSITIESSGSQSTFVGEAAIGADFDDLESHKISTAQSLAASRLDADFGFVVDSQDLDLTTDFLVVVVRRDCNFVPDDTALLVDTRSAPTTWEMFPPVADRTDCDRVDLSLIGYVVDRGLLPVFDDLPEGRP